MTEDEAFERAVSTYLEQEAEGLTGGSRPPDRTRSIVIIAVGNATVILRDTAGVPLGTVNWYGYGEPEPTFEPPTRLTVVDHFQSLRPREKPQNPILVIGDDEFEYEHDDEVMRIWRWKDNLRGELVGTIHIFTGDTISASPTLDPFARYLRQGEIEGQHIAQRTEKASSGSEGLLVVCQCGRAADVRLSPGTRTYKAWMCEGGHWTKVDVTHAATRDPG
jgi:hypothetical protein